jgi:hypothetical protein
MTSTYFGIDFLGTLVMIFGCALLALETIQLAILAVFLFPARKLIVASFWKRITFVRSIRIWFRKRAKQPGKSKGLISTPKRSQLTERKRGRTRAMTILGTTILVALLFSRFIGRTLSFSFRPGTFEDGARGFTVASERARNLVKRSKLTTRKRGRLRTRMILVALLSCHLIGRVFSSAFRLETFEDQIRNKKYTSRIHWRAPLRSRLSVRWRPGHRTHGRTRLRHCHRAQVQEINIDSENQFVEQELKSHFLTNEGG